MFQTALGVLSSSLHKPITQPDHRTATPPLQTIGPFTIGQTVRFKTVAENTAGSAESTVKQITMM